MTASSASLPQRRRDALRQQLLHARSQGDNLAIKRIERQWVHRYGVATLHQLTRDPLASEDSTEDITTGGDGADESASSLPSIRVDETDALVAEPSLQVEPASIDVVSDARADHSSATSRLSRIPLVAPEQMPPPPAPRLDRLRRWLPARADELPRAS